jgi:ABC-type glycerol-3-phosphate transport system substrate-binding protein
MTQIEFSIIPDTQEEFNLWSDLLKEFHKNTGIDTRAKRLTWGMAWPELMSYASMGRGADISHIGSTWVSSLVVMNALSPITTEMLEGIGRMSSYLPAAWQSTKVDSSEQPWSIPLSFFTYVIAYRKDSLASLGIDETTAFSTPENISSTVDQIQKLKNFPTPWVTPIVPTPFNDLIHLAASWIWNKGGEFMDQTGRRVKFDEEPALQGLKEYFHVLRCNSIQRDYFGTDSTAQVLFRGEAAAVITDLRSFATEMSVPHPQSVKGNIGVTTTTNTPWLGGGNLVIWKHARSYPEKFQAAHHLAEFLMSKSTMLAFGRQNLIIPARIDALDELFPADNIISPLIKRLNESGRSYRATSSWHRIEYQLGVELGNLLYKLQKKNEDEFNAEMTKQIRDLAHRLNLAFA